MHLHCYLLLSRKCNLKDPHALDLGSYHGNYRGCRSPSAVKEYCTKENNFITNLDPKSLVKSNPYMEALAEATKGDLKQALSVLAASPQGAKDLVTRRDCVIRSLRQLRPRRLEILHPLSSYKLPTLWDPRYTLILSGKSGLGKTSLAKALMPTALLCSHMDTLKNYDPSVYFGIIFDDMNFSHFPRESQIHLVDTFEDRDLHCRHVTAYLPAGTPRICTTNLHGYNILLLNDEAIQRRCTEWEFKGIQKIKKLS